MYQPIYFDLEELVCPHIYYKWGSWVWQFFDPRLLKMLDWVREKHGPIFMNNWENDYKNSDYIIYIRGRMQNNLPVIADHVPKSPKGLLDERGVRCNLCSLVNQKTKDGKLYITPHLRWQAGDFEVQGKTAEEIRQWMITNKSILPYSVRLEKNVSWVHMDVVDSDEKVQLVNP